MKKTVMQKWVEALRSGKYKQGRGQLRKGKGKAARHCCLGVLCDIYNPTKWENNMFLSRNSDGNTYTEDMSLPSEVMEWAGLKDDNGEKGCKVIAPKYKSSNQNYEFNLIHLNDTKKYSFKKIANIIEKYYKKF